MMEEATFKKDTTPYLIFECSKCKQFMYVKITQKGKKCLRCGRAHVVSKLVVLGEIVYGMTAAVEEVKRKQNDFSLTELGHDPELRAFTDFKVSGFTPQSEECEQTRSDREQEEDFSDQFTKMLREIKSTYKTFPNYVLEVMADNYMIPHSTLKSLINQFQKKGILIKSKDNSYKINL